MCEFASKHLNMLAPESHAALIEELAKISFCNTTYVNKFLNWTINDEVLKVKKLEDIMSSLINSNQTIQEDYISLYYKKIKENSKANSLIHFFFLEKHIKKE